MLYYAGGYPKEVCVAWIKIIHEDEAQGELEEQYSRLVEPWGGVDNSVKIQK